MPDLSNLTPVQTVIVLACLIVVALIGVYVLITGTPPTTSTPAARKRILNLIPDGLDGPIYDLGSGWGTLAVALARRVPWCRVIGIEMSPVPYWVSLAFRRIVGLTNLDLRRGNFHHADIGAAKVVVLYLGRGPMRVLRPKLSRELKPGTLVISNAFPIPGWAPSEIYNTGGLFGGKVFFYRMGEAGTEADASLLFDPKSQ